MLEAEELVGNLLGQGVCVKEGKGGQCGVGGRIVRGHLETFLACRIVDRCDVNQLLAPRPCVHLQEVQHWWHILWLRVDDRLTVDDNPACDQPRKHVANGGDRLLRLGEDERHGSQTIAAQTDPFFCPPESRQDPLDGIPPRQASKV